MNITVFAAVPVGEESPLLWYVFGPFLIQRKKKTFSRKVEKFYMKVC